MTSVLIDNLVTQRKQQGVSQKELAKRMGISQPTLSYFEAGRYNDIKFSTITRYVEALNCYIYVQLIPKTQ